MPWLSRSEKTGRIIIARSWWEILICVIVFILALCVIIVAFIERWSYIVDSAAEFGL